MIKYKIYFLVPVLRGGGAERNIINLITHLDKNKYDISIVAGNIGGNLEFIVPQYINIINLKCSNFLNLFAKLFWFFKKKKSDILVSALPHINTIAMMAKYFSGVYTKIVLTEHTVFSLIPFTARTFSKRIGARFILPHFMRFFYPLADSIICVSNGVLSDLSKFVGTLAIMKVIYNPVFDEAIYSLSKEALGQDQYIFNEKNPIIISVGRLVKAKDYPTLLKSFKLVLDTMPANLIILGEGPEENNLKNIVEKLNIAQNVNFLGFKSNPYKYMANSSVFVLSSVREGFGNVIVEAMACGVPTIATDCKSGPGEIIQDRVNGILVKPKNEKELSKSILEILKNPSFAKKISSAGQERARYFSITKSVGEYEKVFNELLSDKKNG